MDIKILSLNVASRNDLAGLLQIIEIEKPEICFLQEVTMKSEELRAIVEVKGFTGEANVDETNVKKPGTAVVWKLGLAVSEVFSVIQNRGQSVKFGGRIFLNIYAPSGGGVKKQERRDFFGGDVFRLVRSLGNTVPVLVGDFNSVISPLDCEERFVDKKWPSLLDLVSGFNYVDVFRHLHPRAREYTFFRPSCTPSRLDRVYIHRGSGQNVQAVVWSEQSGP